MDISRENEGKIYVAAGDLEVHHGVQPYKAELTPPPQNYYYPSPAQSPPSQHTPTVHYNPVAPPPPPPKDVEEPKRIMGLRRPTFWLVIVLVLVIAVAAVGGGVGGSLAVENARKEALNQQAGSGAGAGSTSTPTTTSRDGSQASTANAPAATTPNASTVNGAIIVPTVGVLPLQCPGLTGTSETITFQDRSWTYDLSCGTDFVANDTVALVMYTLTDCLRACSSYNMNIDRFRPATKKCVGIAFNRNLRDSVRIDFGTCWLKDTVADPVTRSNTDLVGAQLVAET